MHVLGICDSKVKKMDPILCTVALRPILQVAGYSFLKKKRVAVAVASFE